MDLLRTLQAARARAAANPEDPAAWFVLAEVLDVADRGALDADAGFQLAVDRWEALTRLATLAPTADHLGLQVTCLASLSGRARDRGHADLAVAMAREQAAAARVWMRVASEPDVAAKLLVQAGQSLAEHGMARRDSADAAAGLVHMLEALHVLARRSGRPEYALQLAGVHLHLSRLAGEGARTHLVAARDLLDKLDAAGLSHPVQAEVRAEVEERLRAVDGD